MKQELGDDETNAYDGTNDAVDNIQVRASFVQFLNARNFIFNFLYESLQSELECLVGTKCQAPFREEWSECDSASYHNALIMGIDATDSLENIKVPYFSFETLCSFNSNFDCVLKR